MSAGAATGLLALLLCGCATIMTGTADEVSLTSEPSGATVRIQPGLEEVRTPARLTLLRKDGPYLLSFELDSYESRLLHHRLTPIGGETGDAPQTCQTPCRAVFQPDETYELELHAPGYYRARLPVEYRVMYHYREKSDSEEPRFVIPLLPHAAE